MAVAGELSTESKERRALRELLAELYDNRDKARRLLSDAGFEAAGFDFDGASLDRWFKLLEQAERLAETWEAMRARLLEVARKDFSERVRAWERDQAAFRRGGTSSASVSGAGSGDAERERLGRELAAARERRQQLTALGADTGEVDGEILSLKRQRRGGGRLREGDALGDGRYVLVKRIGRGGFATVWEAHDRDESVRVATKVLHAELGGDPVRRDRFFRGARIMRELAHESVVRVLDPEGEDDGFYYFVMELLAGGDLRARALGHPLPPVEAFDIVQRVGEALALAHGRGLVHRDVKPANVLLDAAGRPKLTDFDLVGGHDTTGGTRTGALGTFVYAAPELMDRPQDATPAADVYGLATTAIFLLRGQELGVEFLRNTPAMIGKLPCVEALKAVLVKATDIDPAARFPDAAAFCAALAGALDAPSVPEQPAVALVPGPPDDPREQASLTAGAPRLHPVEGIEWVWVPAGTFLMGASGTVGVPGFDAEASLAELPARRVSIARGFFIGRHPVTNATYRAFLAASRPREEWSLWGDRRFNGDAQPVGGVSWNDASAFCEWLTSKLPAGFEASLPTEEEWEYAARGTDGRRYPWGNDSPTVARAVFGQSVENGRPAAVGGRPAGASPFGCEDMAGNVWEWCLGPFRLTYAGSSNVPNDPIFDPVPSPARVVRGGAFDSGRSNLRVAKRDGYPLLTKAAHLGFRVVCRLPLEHVGT